MKKMKIDLQGLYHFCSESKIIRNYPEIHNVACLVGAIIGTYKAFSAERNLTK